MYLIGVYWLLAYAGTFAIVVSLYVICVLPISWIREIRDGIGYNFCASVTLGIFSLTGVVVLAANILHQQHTLPIQLNWFQLLWAPACIMIGQKSWKVARGGGPQASGDGYHNVVVVPVVLYILGLSAPILWLYGNFQDWFLVGLSLIFWTAFFLLDSMDGRLQQRPLFLLRLRLAYIRNQHDME